MAKNKKKQKCKNSTFYCKTTTFTLQLYFTVALQMGSICLSNVVHLQCKEALNVC